MGLRSVLIIDVVGLENFSPAFGLVSLSFAVANIPSQSTVGNTCLLDKITMDYELFQRYYCSKDFLSSDQNEDIHFLKATMSLRNRHIPSKMKYT